MDLFQRFLILALSYFLFYYSAPYWSSAQIKDVINYGSYQSLFIRLSSIGHWLYKGVETLNNWADEKLKLMPGGTVHGAINAVVYTGIIWIATYVYNGVRGMVLQGSGSYTLSFSEWSQVTNAATFLESVWLRMGEAPGFLSGASTAAVSLLLYAGVTVLYSAFIYGLLRYKIKEFNLGTRISEKLHTKKPQESDNDSTKPQESDGKSFLSQVRGKLIPNLKASFVSCLDNLCLLRSFHIIGSLILFCGMIFLYSLVMMFLNRESEVSGILAGILEASGVVDVVLSFLIAFVWGKILSLLGITVYIVAPTPVKAAIDRADRKGKQFVEKTERIRKTWAEDNDGLFKRTEGEGLHLMDLLGRGK